jgi:heptosyltransferase-2
MTRKILIIRYRFIGDTLLTTPFIKNTKEIFPDAKIDLIVSPNSGEIIEGNPNVNNVYYLDTTKFHKYEKGRDVVYNVSSETFTSLFSCAKSLRKEKYDLIFVLKRSFSSAFLAFLIGGKERIGFNTEARSFLLTKTISYDKNLHELDNFLNCLKPYKKTPERYNPEIFPTSEEKQKAKELISSFDSFKPKILIHASSAHPYKMWPKRYFANLMDMLYEKYKAQFLFTGAGIDGEIYENILRFSRYSDKFKYINLCGKTTIRECYALYENLHLAICVDSGNSHLAAAAGIPTYTLYGPTRPEKWLPVGEKVFPLKLEQNLPCQPCDVKVVCSHVSCMKLLKPEYVFNQLERAFLLS